MIRSIIDKLHSKKPSVTAMVEDGIEEYLTVPASVMDATFDRSAGRWCEACGFNGSHHTDKHNDFARHALNKLTLTY